MDEDMQGTGSETINPVLGNVKLEEVSDVDNRRGLSHILKDDPNLDSSESPTSSPSLENLRFQSPSRKYNKNQDPEWETNELFREENEVNTSLEQVPKSLRKSTQNLPPHSTPLLQHLPDVFDEAISVFQVIKECIYGSKYMGSSGDHDALDCDCSEQWRNGKNLACGEDSDCINRATKMECVDGDCNCGIGCQNTRFQRRNYANVSVIKTEKKGYGLRANIDLNPNDFIFEYIGEVINEPTFRRRTIQYDQEGIKHFYFMSLTKNEFIDATKKGNLGRFCNHSCNPNCYVDKWVVGDKLRMGIFAERFISSGEELVFNYNVDRYGADPQPCYCGESNCTGFIGGKTQTERATKLPLATIEALGIDDDDGWDTTVAKKPRKKKTGEDDEEYVSSVQPKGLDEEGVRKVMATLMQCKELWIAVKLLNRLQRCEEEKVRNRVVQMHGYQILRTTLMTWKNDNNVILQVLDILYKFPRLTRNKISDSKIEPVIEKLVESEHEDVAFESKRLLELWSKLEVAYRIPRKKFDPSSASNFERRNNDRQEENTKTSKSANTAAPGPRSSAQQRPVTFSARPAIRRTFKPLPPGWFAAKDERGKTYFYTEFGESTWEKPVHPASEPPQQPTLPPKSVQTAKALQDIIDSITKNDSNSNSTERPVLHKELSISKDKIAPAEKWRSMSEEKQMKLYENTLFPHIKHVMQKFHNKLPKEDLKKFAKEVGKKLVASDFKNKRVDNPTKISEKQEKKVKSYVRAYFEKAVAKRKELDRRKKHSDHNSSHFSNDKKKDDIRMDIPKTKEQEAEVFEILSLSSPRDNSPTTPIVKRKREEDVRTPKEDDLSESFKRQKEEAPNIVLNPPPPPPPSDEKCDNFVEDFSIIDDDVSILKMEMEVEVEEKLQLRLQEEDLMRENEEAERLESENSNKTL